MPLGAIAGALAGPLISAGASALLGGIFGGGGGGGGGSVQFNPVDISAGGLTSKTTDRQVGLSASPERLGLVDSLAKTFPGQADLLSKLRQSVAPGMSAMRVARLAQLESQRQATTGDLRDNLARRRVLGSSFAQDSLTRSDLAFAQQKDAVEADSYLQELQLTQQLTNAEYEARRGEFSTKLDELNLETNTAVSLANGATAQMGQNARLKAQLDADSSAGAGKFFGTLTAPIGDAVGKAITKAFA